MDIIRKSRQVLPAPIKAFVKRCLDFRKNFESIMISRANVKPLSDGWPSMSIVIHRYYLEQFLNEISQDIRGHCLEFQEDSYTSRFGGEKVAKIDILHKEEGRPNVTIVADLTKVNEIPSNTFDCIICTYTLHVVYEYRRMVSEMYRILKPNGVLLVAVPCITINYSQYHELWRFTPEGLNLLLSEYFGADSVEIRTYGNSLTAVGELRGLTLHEFSKEKLDQHDSRYSLVVCARARKRF